MLCEYEKQPGNCTHWVSEVKIADRFCVQNYHFLYYLRTLRHLPIFYVFICTFCAPMSHRASLINRLSFLLIKSTSVFF